jgi:hypothetical protein
MKIIYDDLFVVNHLTKLHTPILRGLFVVVYAAVVVGDGTVIVVFAATDISASTGQISQIFLTSITYSNLLTD